MSFGSLDPRDAKRLLTIRADTRRATRQFRRWEKQTLTAERRTLLRASGIVRRMEIAMVQGRKSKAGPKVAPLDKPWRAILHPGKKLGGIFAQKHLWHIVAPNPHEREVDIVPALQTLLAQWQAGGDARPAQLRSRVADWRGNPGAYHRELAGKGGYPPHLSMIPPVKSMPRRDIRTPVEAYAGRHMAEWYAGIWETMQRRG